MFCDYTLKKASPTRFGGIQMAKILIADDSALMRKTIAAILKEANHTIVAEAGNGYEAFQKYDELHPDLVILDINMPYMNGMDALKAILAKHPYAKILMVSSESCSSIITQALSLGAKDYVIKPFCIDGFWTAVNHILQCDKALGDDSLQNVFNTLKQL